MKNEAKSKGSYDSEREGKKEEKYLSWSIKGNWRGSMGQTKACFHATWAVGEVMDCCFLATG
jgi:hypothetical protein